MTLGQHKKIEWVKANTQSLILVVGFLLLFVTMLLIAGQQRRDADTERRLQSLMRYQESMGYELGEEAAKNHEDMRQLLKKRL